MSVRTSPIVRSIRSFSLLALALSGCSSIKVESEYDAAAAPASIETYAWSAEPSSENQAPSDPSAAGVDAINDEAVAQRICREVDANLAARGLRKVPLDQANMLVAQRTNVELKEDDLDSYYAFYSVELFEEGTLTIQFTDAATNRMLWQGTGRTRLRTVGAGTGVSATPAEMFRNPKPRRWPVEEMVDSILTKLSATP